MDPTRHRGALGIMAGWTTASIGNFSPGEALGADDEGRHGYSIAASVAYTRRGDHIFKAGMIWCLALGLVLGWPWGLRLSCYIPILAFYKAL
jgi:hypothetical protein